MLRRAASLVGFGSSESSATGAPANPGNKTENFPSQTLTPPKPLSIDTEVPEIKRNPQLTISHLLHQSAAEDSDSEGVTEADLAFLKDPTLAALAQVAGINLPEHRARVEAINHQYRKYKKLYKGVKAKKTEQQFRYNKLGYNWLGERQQLQLEVSNLGSQLKKAEAEAAELRATVKDLTKEAEALKEKCLAYQLQQSDLSSLNSTELHKALAKYYQLEYVYGCERKRRQELEKELARLTEEFSLYKDKYKGGPKVETIACGVQTLCPPPETLSQLLFTADSNSARPSYSKFITASAATGVAGISQRSPSAQGLRSAAGVGFSGCRSFHSATSGSQDLNITWVEDSRVGKFYSFPSSSASSAAVTPAAVAGSDNLVDDAIPQPSSQIPKPSNLPGHLQQQPQQSQQTQPQVQHNYPPLASNPQLLSLPLASTRRQDAAPFRNCPGPLQSQQQTRVSSSTAAAATRRAASSKGGDERPSRLGTRTSTRRPR